MSPSNLWVRKPACLATQAHVIIRDHCRCLKAAVKQFESFVLCAPGGYDHVCKVWDVRSGTATASVSHGAPIEAVAYSPSGRRSCVLLMGESAPPSRLFRPGYSGSALPCSEGACELRGSL